MGAENGDGKIGPGVRDLGGDPEARQGLSENSPGKNAQKRDGKAGEIRFLTDFCLYGSMIRA